MNVSYMKKARAALIATAVCTLACASAGAQQMAQTTERIEVTGSNIKRLEGETALPVLVITRAEIRNTGALTAQDLLERIPMIQSLGAVNEALGEGSTLVGFTGASLRGFGTGRTLVLVNGKRVAPYALSVQIGGGADLSAIPLAVIERIEILKDGASAVYGTDAIAGVINFILRKDFQGAEASATLLDTQHGGARQTRYSATIGAGDVGKDRWNAFFTADYMKQDPLAAKARAISHTAYIPELGIDGTTGNSVPANISQPGGFTGTFNPTIPVTGASPTSCLPPFSFPTTRSPQQCRFDFASVIETIPSFTKEHYLGRATFQVTPQVQAYVEGAYYKGTFDQRISPTPIPEIGVLQPTSPFYPAAFIATIPGGDPTLPVVLSYRSLETGPRYDQAKVDQSQLIAGLQGAIGRWDYSTSFNYTANQQIDTLKSGYLSEARWRAVFATGTVNPFALNTPAVIAQLQDALVMGDASKNTAKNHGVDARLSTEIMQLAAGPLALAFGLDYRKEQLDLVNADFVSNGDIIGGAGSIPSLVGVSRKVSAAFAEMNIPLLRNLEMNVAARYDHYSDFGNTTNPKLTLRWIPTREFLLRAAYGTGFRAPTLSDLFQPMLMGITGGAYDDPLRCPTTQTVNDCNTQMNVRTGGNAALKPERSKQWYAGLVFEPGDRLSIGVDYYRISMRDVIGAISDSTIFADYNRYAPTQIVRGPVDPQFPSLPGPIAYVLEDLLNFGKQETSGIDVDVTCRFAQAAIGRIVAKLNGSYVMSWKQTTFDSSDYPDYVGLQRGLGAVSRWRHFASLNWARGPWGATLTQNFQLGYHEDDLVNGGLRRVGNYEIYDAQARWEGMENVVVSLGVRNVFDRAPPPSTQSSTFQIGYDPSYGDPRGRMFYGTIRVSFR
jgi:iron complex outermembrane recepter protein